MTSAEVISLAVFVGFIHAFSSAYLGPFVLVPTGNATCAMFFAMHVSRSERLIVTAIPTVSGIAPFVVEAAGLVPPGLRFEDGRASSILASSSCSPPRRSSASPG